MASLKVKAFFSKLGPRQAILVTSLSRVPSVFARMLYGTIRLSVELLETSVSVAECKPQQEMCGVVKAAYPAQVLAGHLTHVTFLQPNPPGEGSLDGS